MNKRACVIYLSILFAHVACAQNYRTTKMIFKGGSYWSLADTTMTNILTTTSFSGVYGEKTRLAHIECAIWSPDMHYIALAISNVRTGDHDDIWVLSMRDSSVSCLTRLFPVRLSGTYGVPVWKNRDTLMFSAGSFVATVDVPNNRIVSQTPFWKAHDPSRTSPDGRLRYEFDGTGARLSVVGHEGKTIVTVGEGRTRSGSILGVAFSSNGRFLAVEQFEGHGDSRILVADIQSHLFNILKLNFGRVSTIVGNSNWYPQMPVLLVSDANGRLHFLNMFTQADDQLGIPGYYVIDGAISPDLSQIALILQHQMAQTYALRIVKNPFTQ